MILCDLRALRRPVSGVIHAIFFRAPVWAAQWCLGIRFRNVRGNGGRC
jgi:hypothetical protein